MRSVDLEVKCIPHPRPTDTARLRFVRELTRFENLALDMEDHGYADAQVGGVETFAGEGLPDLDPFSPG